MPGLRVEQTDWYTSGPTLRKDYQYDGLASDTSRHKLRIDIDVSPNGLSGIPNVHICFLIGPHLWPGSAAGYLVAQLALTGQLLDAPFVTVRQGTCDDGSLILAPCSREDAQTFLGVLSQGAEMRLLLLDQTERLLELPIPNDEQYLVAARSFFGKVSAPAEGAPNQKLNTDRGAGTRGFLSWLVFG